MSIHTIIIVCIAIVALCMVVGLIAIVSTSDRLSRAVMADMIFYAMVAMFFIWTLLYDTWIGYEIAILAALASGAIPTMSMARVIARGRR
ncbi:cation:proton antiporter [Corynebacterium aquatimens]|uniref:Multicomponent Na+:H+ antiporter subunit F n=1 Tax=Corynebacterium aquatimens TaxID=1190508 RepID=A0A931DY91_9CORY|nr:cation:proton antiporter [Corynebacterium aquatimens]MBG6122552.1 multicomponent Na+:H+ antiporter subunit F [Corynebacterium aquatimens]WJY64908.1 putative monovalent cation/H+ antiporter subunit F [Corynebacterium aquatimens]